MQAVNLLPAYARPGSRWTALGKDLAPGRVLTLGGAVAAAVAVGVGALYLHERNVVNDRRSDLADTQSRLAASEAIAAPIRAAAANRSAYDAAARSVIETRVAWPTALADLARQIPTQAYLQSMQVALTAPTTSTPTTPTTSTDSTSSSDATSSTAITTAPASAGTFSISGTASSHVRVALILDQLAALPWLSDVTLTSSTRGEKGDSFAISAGFTGTGATK